MSSAKSGQMKSVRLGRTLACHEVKSQVFISQVLTDSEEATLRDELTCRFFCGPVFFSEEIRIGDLSRRMHLSSSFSPRSSEGDVYSGKRLYFLRQGIVVTFFSNFFSDRVSRCTRSGVGSVGGFFG